MYKILLLCVAYLLVTVALSRSTVTRRFLDVDCDEKVNCSEEHAPVCGTDGKTYNNKCLIELENQRKVCVIGDFNPVVYVHDGACNETQMDDNS